MVLNTKSFDNVVKVKLEILLICTFIHEPYHLTNHKYKIKEFMFSHGYTQNKKYDNMV